MTQNTDQQNEEKSYAAGTPISRDQLFLELGLIATVCVFALVLYIVYLSVAKKEVGPWKLRPTLLQTIRTTKK